MLVRLFRRFAIVTLAALLAWACGGDFDPVTAVKGVRVLSSKTDKPYARPGERVKVELLALDGRENPPRPMQISWLPAPCINPLGDAYYACFSTFASLAAAAGGGSGQGSGSAAGLIRPGVNISPFLPHGRTFSFVLPDDIIETHPVIDGTGERYGLAIAFFIACAGHIELLEREDINPQSLPVGCFDDEGNRLGADDYVFGFSRVYAYDTITNANPKIEALVIDGERFDPNDGLVFSPCPGDGCKKHEIDVVVPESVQEVAEQTPTEASGQRSRELVWTAYFATGGEFESPSRLIFDPTRGAVGKTENEFEPPAKLGPGRLFIIIHDNRGGADWVSIPFVVR